MSEQPTSREENEEYVPRHSLGGTFDAKHSLDADDVSDESIEETGTYSISDDADLEQDDVNAQPAFNPINISGEKINNTLADLEEEFDDPSIDSKLEPEGDVNRNQFYSDVIDSTEEDKFEEEDEKENPLAFLTQETEDTLSHTEEVAEEPKKVGKIHKVIVGFGVVIVAGAAAAAKYYGLF